MAEGAKEMNPDEDFNDDYIGNLTMREVSVEELLPRDEIAEGYACADHGFCR